MAISINLQIGTPKGNQSPASHNQQLSPSKRGLKWTAAIIALLVIVLAGFGGYRHFYAPHKTGGSAAAYRQLFVAQQQSASFPLYYLADVPSGYAVVPDSLSLQAATFNFTVIASDTTKLVVIEQPRPPLLEDVTKIKDVASSIGSASLANLNGQKAGIIVTEKTLITISSLTASPEQIEPIITALKPVQ